MYWSFWHVFKYYYKIKGFEKNNHSVSYLKQKEVNKHNSSTSDSSSTNLIVENLETLVYGKEKNQGEQQKN